MVNIENILLLDSRVSLIGVQKFSRQFNFVMFHLRNLMQKFPCDCTTSMSLPHPDDFCKAWLSGAQLPGQFQAGRWHFGQAGH